MMLLFICIMIKADTMQILPPVPSEGQLTQSDLLSNISRNGFSFVSGDTVRQWLLCEDALSLNDWQMFADSWQDMPLDLYMADGGRYRRRRYAVLSAYDGEESLTLEPHQPHYQSLDYNSLNGGVARDFAPIATAVIQSRVMQTVLKLGRQLFTHFFPEVSWHIECHQFRIEAAAELLGKPTPEGVHRDGVDFVLVMMVRRHNISSGITTMHDLDQKQVDSFTLAAPMDMAVVNDRRCMHGVTPIHPIDPKSPAYRDVLVLTYRKI